MEKRFLSSRNRRFAAIAAAVLSLCLVGTLAFQGVQKAQAASLDLEKDCTVTVALSTNSSSGTAYVAPPSNLHVKLYKVAEAVQQPGFDAYTFEIAAGFKSLTADVEELANATAATSSSLYKALSEAAATIVAEAASPIMPVCNAPVPDEKLSAGPGLYLMVAYGSDVYDANNDLTNVLVPNPSKVEGAAPYVSVAYSPTQKFTFAPELIALPTKEAVDGVINSANPGDWVYDPTVTLKYELSQRTGSLAIDKSLLEFEQTEGMTNNEATFVFDIKGFSTQEDANAAAAGAAITPVYSNVASVSFNAAGTNRVTVDNIPAGIYVVVTEIYSGTSYKPVGTTPQIVPIVATDNNAASANGVSVAFQNAYNADDPSPNKGGSVTNSFKVGDDGEWVWSKDGVQQGGQQGGGN